MKLLLLACFCAVAAFAQTPCDDKPHVVNGVTLSCKVISGEEFTAVELTLLGSSNGPAMFSVGVAGNYFTLRRSFPLIAYPPFNEKHTYTVFLPASVLVNYVDVEEYRLFNSAGFGL